MQLGAEPSGAIRGDSPLPPPAGLLSLLPVADHCPLTAYWIAFGPHGPRAMPPPDEGRRVALYTAVGVAVSFAIFATMRMFAKPAPRTMSKEYQEASNEYLKVREAAASRRLSWKEPILTFLAGPKRRAPYWSLLARLPGQGYGSVTSSALRLWFAFCVTAASILAMTGKCPPRREKKIKQPPYFPFCR